MKKNKYLILSFTSLLVFVLLWSLTVRFFHIQEFFLPPPIKVLSSLYFLFTIGNFFQDIVISILRISAGFVLGFGIALPIGVVLATHKKLKSIIEPFIEFIRYTPLPAFIPLFILWLGIGEMEKIIVIASSVFFVFIPMVIKRIQEVPKEIIESAQTFGMGKSALIVHILYASAQPKIFHDLRICLGLAWSTLLIAEMVGSTSGLGYVIIQSQRLLQTAHVMSSICIIGLLGIGSNTLFKYMEKKLFPWYKPLYD